MQQHPIRKLPIASFYKKNVTRCLIQHIIDGPNSTALPF